MAAVWMRLRAELRQRWRAWLSLALLFGISAGAAVAAFAGARRTDTAYPRFVVAQDGFHAFTGGGGSRGFAERFEALKRHPAVADFTEQVVVGAELTIPAKPGRKEAVAGFPDVLLAADPAGRTFYETNRAKVIEGRLADRRSLTETMVPFVIADRYRIDVGDTVIAGVGFTEEFTAVEDVPLRVVGIYAAPGSFESIGQGVFSVVSVTPALFEKYRDVVPSVHSEAAPDVWALSLHLKGGSTSAHAFKRAVERDLNIDVPIIEPVIRSGVQKTLRLYAVALWLLGSLIAAATVAVVGQTIARQQLLEADEYPVLRALGTTPGQLVGLGMLRAGLIGVVASGIASVSAYLFSPLTPIGPARFAEPSPGLAFDATAIGIGAAAVLVLVPLVALIPSVRAARWSEATERATSGTSVAWAMARAITASRSPATATGLRMALEPGRGRTAVPVRSTVLTVALGVAAMVASVVVGRSLTHLIESPALIGFTYDAIIPESDLTDEETAARLRALPFTERVARGTLLNAVFGGVDSFVLGFADDAPIGYALIDGRAPVDTKRDGDPEIALGPAIMRRLDLAIGDSVEFAYPDPSQSEREESEEPFVRNVLTKRALIVGVAAVPPFPFAITEPGEGAVMSADAIGRLNLGDPSRCCFISFKPGTDLDAAGDRIVAEGFQPFLRTKRADVATLGRISRLPVLLSAIFAAIASAALAHVLVTAIRRRRRDLAILKALGFVKSQVRRAIAWQVSTIAALAIVVGIPVGIALGRWSWHLIALQFGVVPVSLAPLALLALVLPAGLVLGNLVAALPGRSAARTLPALVLRAE